ncbi:integrin alpha-E isoform X2 [Myxocyprinus asiaticus]|uniref:integrin alpha-E isoform X2 n=1 Tax=Myxocyprinus asiaticus TaxID=70543 RepID=UPI002221AFF3|nr:integrin alpha-E isoform X2 [Myxocyprinus asiaticus]
MYRGLVFMIVICSVTGFNIQKLPVKNFTMGDSLFGQTVIQSTDGVFVPSPTTGILFKCTLEKGCVEVGFNDDSRKGLRPITSVATSLISEEEHLLVCKQARTKISGSDNLNGKCMLMNPTGNIQLNPAELVSKQIEENAEHNSNNNNNRYRSGRIYQVKQRTRRDSQPSSDTKADEDEDDDDDGTEIAFVLDGSGSIDAPDFERAKDFIYNVMMKVWKTCFNCDFAIVQYGSMIRTELSLLDNAEGTKTLEKVKNIHQIYNLTKTASAINHVLTNIFVPENGSKNNSRKIIIVVSDGEILGDKMNLTDVLKKPQMNGIIRFAIGVGEKVLSVPKAINEMKEIADPNNFFNVSNYAALDSILSLLEQSITEGIEGTQQGAGFKFQLAEAGFSTHIMHDKSVLFGAVGAYDWSGGVILKSDDSVKFFNDSKNEPKFSYLGYSVASARLPTKTVYISGAPRYNLTGGVFVFEGSEKYVLQGDQVGSYFGSVICALDIDMNGYIDYMLVGAPHFHQNGEEGKVLVYKLNQERFESMDRELRGDAGQTFARFGAAIASIGDIDGNKYNDVAVGAPLETDSSGSIYIYNGFEDGLQFSQKISPSDFGIKLKHFGQSVSTIGLPDTTKIKPCIAVGSQGIVTVFETIPVVIIKPDITTEPGEIPLTEQMIEIPRKFIIKLSVCFSTVKGKLSENENLTIQYKIDLDSSVNKKRLSAGSDLMQSTFLLTSDAECIEPIYLKYLGCYDCFSSIKIKLHFSLAPNSKGSHLRILDVFTPTEAVREITFKKGCKNNVCKPSITLSDSKISENMIIIGETQSLNIIFNLTNTEDPSYLTILTLTYPNILNQKKTEGAPCPVKNDNQIQCHLQHPVFHKDSQTSLFISWQLNDTKSDLKNSEIIANLTSNNEGAQVLDSKIYKFDVKYALPIQLTGTASPNRFRIEEGRKGGTEQQLQFEFEFVGENKYGATIDLAVNITKDTSKTEMHINKVTPKECVMPQNNKVEGSYLIKCAIKELQKIVIDAKVLIHDVQEKSDNIIAVGQYSFDETLYTAKDTLRTVPVEVTITKLPVTTSKGPIIGGSIGGFLLLIIIIIILIKCGFFRRRRKMDQTQISN